MPVRARPDTAPGMIRFFDMFLGRSTAMRRLDDAFRAAGLHPLLVPEPVKLTVIELTRKHAGTAPQGTDFGKSAALLAYCILGHDQFTDSNGGEITARTDERVDAALEAGNSFDAKLILLALHAGLIAPDIADRLELDDQEPDQT
ncbi:MAG: hypothetical protein HLUCCA05_14665 [Roseibaca calidilacus]|uniref:Uncharacterized protein n=2 Tax=Roseibaca calidilacus TaxID=1666912 RepID=A0A0P7YL14_9RHOB|nr:hypothetical protein [Roseibaca calidilacus]KPP88955.1 MAG: hypothetical protein HLUCCA05_14665 [Roseibaca calidilacus]